MRPLKRNLQTFARLEAAGGICLMAATLVALLLANSEFSQIYANTLKMAIGPYTLAIWINDGLMAIFFFIVGIEIKHEILDGSLVSFERASLPVVGALGGMIAPALVYFCFAGQTENARGWGIPMATDIAFALGVLSLMGRRAPSSLKAFLLALAIVDDIGAILVIAIFYSSRFAPLYFAAAMALFGLIWFLARQSSTRSIWLQLPLGICLWWLVHHSGIHATIAGCALGFLMPRELLKKWIDRLHPVSGFVIMPLFALANAGLAFGGISWSMILTNRIVSGISYGLIVGKSVGVFSASWLAVRLGFAKLPDGVGWQQLFGISALAGIGFTMALFIADLALKSPEAIDLAKIGIMKGSLISALIGSALLIIRRRHPAKV